MTTQFEITENLTRGVKSVICNETQTGKFVVSREAKSFRSPRKWATFDTVAECREWASQFVK